MLKQPFCSFSIAGVNINEYGLMIPSPFCSLSITNAQIQSFLSWELKVVVLGDAQKQVNVAAFEALLYSASQSAANSGTAQRVPVSFMIGWQNSDGSVGENLSYQGFFLKWTTSTNGLTMTYTITGYASIGFTSALPVFPIPAVCGMVQPSAVFVALCKALKIDTYYDLDVDHNDAVTMVNHGAMTTSFNAYAKGSFSATDDYANFPGLVKLSKSYSTTRDAAGLKRGYTKLSHVLNNISYTPLDNFFKKSFTDYSPQCSTYSLWIDEPTTTQRGKIHYKSNAGLLSTHWGDTLEYGTANTNILSLSGSYNGVAYNMTNMDYSDVGFSVDGSGNTIVQTEKIVNSWSATLADVYQTVNIINDVNALASQFSGDFTIEIPGTVKQYSLAQPVSLLVVSGGSISPVTGVYNVVSVEHRISNTFTTILKVQRLVMSSANEVATSQTISINNNPSYKYAYTQTSNVISSSKVEFGTIYPTYEDIQVV